jgi:hypothetical protein
LFSQEKFVTLSDKFVCVKLATFENQQHQDMCKNLLGDVRNTSFTIFDPTAKNTLVKPSRSPRLTFGGKSPYAQIEEIASKYKSSGSDGKTVLQDFHSLKQALVASSADQKLLVLTIGQGTNFKEAIPQVSKVFNHQDVRGIAHYDQVTSGSEKWQSIVKGNKISEGHYIVKVEPYGRYGTVINELSLTASSSTILAALKESNKAFTASEKRKDYQAHVKTGIDQGIHSDTNISRAAVKAGKNR